MTWERVWKCMFVVHNGTLFLRAVCNDIPSLVTATATLEKMWSCWVYSKRTIYMIHTIWNHRPTAVFIMLSQTSAITPDYDEFTGFIFKLQANLDPRHRDRLAYVRIVSGRYEKGMKVGQLNIWLNSSDRNLCFKSWDWISKQRSPCLYSTKQRAAGLSFIHHWAFIISFNFPRMHTYTPETSFTGHGWLILYLCCYMQVQHSRMKGKQVTLAHAQQLFAQERETVLVSYGPQHILWLRW